MQLDYFLAGDQALFKWLNQCYRCSWYGDARNQDIISHDIDHFSGNIRFQQQIFLMRSNELYINRRNLTYKYSIDAPVMIVSSSYGKILIIILWSHYKTADVPEIQWTSISVLFSRLSHCISYRDIIDRVITRLDQTGVVITRSIVFLWEYFPKGTNVW